MSGIEIQGPGSMKRNSSRERRILDEIIVDAYAPEEQAMGWYYYRRRGDAKGGR